MQPKPKENLYKKPCKVCQNTVYVREGYIARENGRWETYCKPHWPYRIEGEKRELTFDGYIKTPRPSKKELDLIRAMPGAEWDKRRQAWKVSLQIGDRPRIIELAERLELDICPDLLQYNLSEEAQRAQSTSLYGYQVDGVHFLSSRNTALLGDQMGSGKTPQAIVSLPLNASAIVVVPACVKYNWAAEFAKWRPEFHVKIMKGRGSFEWPAPNEVIITNYDILPQRFHPVADKNNKYKEHMSNLEKNDREKAAKTNLIIDEAHKVKNGKTKQAGKIRGLTRICKTVWALTGTPLLNRPGDLWGMLYNLGMAHDVFGSFYRYKELFHAYQGRFGLVWGKPDPIVPELLRRVMLRRLRADILPDLPKKTYTELRVDAIPRILKKELDVTFDEWGAVLEVENKLPSFDKFSELRKELALSRIPAMKDYIKECEENEEPLLVFSAHREPILEAGGRKGWAAITGTTSPKKRQKIVDDFQAGKLKGVALTIQAGGVGLTLTRAWKVLFVDLDWTPANNCQAEDRVCRIGQMADKVEIIRMVSDHPLDEHVLKLISEKMKLIEMAIEREIKLDSSALSGVNGESEEDHKRRLELIAKIAEEALQKKEENQKTEADWEEKLAKAKVARYKVILQERAKIREKRKQKIVFDIGLKDEVRHAFEHMLKVCDGAKAPDGVGFNKPDSHIAQYIRVFGIENEDCTEAAYYLLRGYKSQLKTKFPKLFKTKRKKKKNGA